jgi:hypothetical protein
VGAHYSLSSLFAPYGERVDIFSYSVKRLDHHTAEAGKLRMALGQASFTSNVTRESETLTFWVVHFGDHNVAGGVQKSDGSSHYQDMLSSISGAFERVDIPEVVRLLDRRFGDKTYSLRSLFRDEQRRIVHSILASTVAEAEAGYLHLYDQHAALMRFIISLGTPMPREFTAAMEYAVNSLLKRACSAEELDSGRIRNLLREAQLNNITLDKTTLEFLLRHKLETLANRLSGDPSNLDKLLDLQHALTTVRLMPFPINLWQPQNHIYGIQMSLYPRIRRRAQRGESRAQEWLAQFEKLCELLTLRLH